MREFLNTPYGAAIFIAIDIIALVALIAITYRFCCKRLLSWLLSIVCLAVTWPIFLWVYLKHKKYKKSGGEINSFLRRDPIVGKGGKTVWKTSFETRKADGELADEYGQGLETRAVRVLPRLLDVFWGRAAFVGVSALRFEDAAFLDDEQEVRYQSRVGLISPLKEGEEEKDVEDVLDEESVYAERYGLFVDLKVLFGWIISKIRGEKRKAWDTSYAKFLYEKKEISQEEYESVLASAAEEEKEWREARQPERLVEEPVEDEKEAPQTTDEE